MPDYASAADGQSDANGRHEYTNRLINETSPYLLQHAHNPVDWYPWGPEAFEKAKRENKPIFLSVGYSTCYWCHVMERQVFENADIAALMNELFVNIKVDREERPDVDDLYMTATQLMTGRGGWPMSVFLTPPTDDDLGLRPFWAGTYIPPEPMQGMPSFPQVLQGLSRAWTEQPQRVLEQAERVSEAVRQQLEQQDTKAPLQVEYVQQAVEHLLRMYDAQHGGFGQAPKFPQPIFLQLLLSWHKQVANERISQAITYTLDRMARGGMYDQVGGGFHRYSVDDAWLVPHFEKMLYDNGQLAELYADAAAAFNDTEHGEQFARIAREICDYALRDMTDASGAFWSAQDAEVNAREGQNYLWTPQQVQASLSDPKQADLALQMYGLNLGTNFRDPHHPDEGSSNVLFLPKPLDELADELGMDRSALLQQREEINEQLLAVRSKRDQPGTDDKVLVAWNGMMIAGLAIVGRVLDEPKYGDAAARSAQAIVDRMSDGRGGLYRSMREGRTAIPAFLEDYAFFTHGLIALHRARPDDSRFLQWAKQYTQVAIDQFASDAGGYFDTLEDQRDLFVRLRSTYDGAIPSGNSQMVHNLLDLYEITGDPAYLDRAWQDLTSFGKSLRQQGVGMAHMVHALNRALAISPERVETPTTGEPMTQEGVVAVSIAPDRLNWRDGQATVQVRLDIAPGYHINSSDSDQAGLIPTSLDLVAPSDLSLEVAYPDPQQRHFTFADQPLMVYEKQVVLRATLGAEGRPVTDTVRLRLRYQACDDTACLAPQTIELTLSPAD